MAFKLEVTEYVLVGMLYINTEIGGITNAYSLGTQIYIKSVLCFGFVEFEEANAAQNAIEVCGVLCYKIRS